jgi:hypothetical protein
MHKSNEKCLCQHESLDSSLCATAVNDVDLQQRAGDRCDLVRNTLGIFNACDNT